MANAMPGRSIVSTLTEGTGDYTFVDPIGDTFQLPTNAPTVEVGDLAPFFVVDDLEAPTRVEMNAPAAVTATTQARNVVRSYDPDNGGWGTGPVDWPAGLKFIAYDLDPATLSKLLQFIWIGPATLAKTASYTVAIADNRKVVAGDATAGAITLTLPAAATAGNGFEIAAKKIGSANAVTFEPDGAEEIDGASALALTGEGEAATLRSDGVGWHVVGRAAGRGVLGGFRNLLMNGLGTINQRGYSSGAATSGANEYTLDRWRVVVSGQNLAWTESEGVRTMTAPAGGVEQVVEGANVVTGTYTISWAGAATCTVGGVAKTSGETVALTGGANVTVRFTGGTFAKPQLEPGGQATAFELRPIGAELALCQRYAVAMQGAVVLAKLRESDRTRIGMCFWPVTMRTTPTVTKTDTLDGFSSISASSSATRCTFQSGGAGNDSSGPNADNIFADAEL